VVLGGQLAIDGSFAITTLTVEGGICYPNNVPASGAAVVTANLNGGLLDFTQSPAARTVTNLNPNRGELRADKNALTVTTFAQPANLYRAAIS
jgi:hypothetical protein